MITYTYKVSMTPGGIPVRCKLGQYDDDWTIVFTLYSAYGTFSIESGTTAKIRGTKRDGLGYSANATINISAGTVTVAGDKQITAVAGDNLFELVLHKGTKELSTANIIFSVEPAAMDAGTLVSDSQVQEILDMSADVIAASDNVNTLRGNFAPAYSTSATYSVGDYVMYNNQLYRCKTAITTAESWTSGHWTAVALGKDVSDLKSDLSEEHDHLLDTNNYVLSPTKNIFNTAYSYDGYTLKNDGSIYQVESGFTSDYIQVFPNTTYHKRYVLNSSTIADAVFYDNSKNYLSYFGNSADGTFTTPASCAYIRICGYINRKLGEVVELGNAFTSHVHYSPAISSKIGGGMSLYLYADAPVLYDYSNKQLFVLHDDPQNETGSNIHLFIPGRDPVTLQSPITVSGSGKYLYYNYVTNMFALSDSVIVHDPKTYCIGAINNVFSTGISFRGNSDVVFISGYDSPVLFIDLVNKKVKVKIPTNTYLFYNSTYSAITSEEYELTGLGNHFVLWLNTRTKKIVSALYATYKNNTNYIPIADVNNSCVQCVIPYVIETIDEKLYGKNIVTYGDSLTWYDGQDYTWGEHQGETCIGYQSYVKKCLGATIINRGVSGKTTPEICTRIKTADDLATQDIMIIMGGDNDDRLSVTVGELSPIGSTYDTTTVYGALQDAIEWALTQNPSLRIVIMTEPIGWTYRNNDFVRVDDSIPQTYRDIAQFYGLPLIDIWCESGVNEFTREILYADPAGNHLYFYHPNNDGWKRISKIICNRLTEV